MEGSSRRILEDLCIAFSFAVTKASEKEKTWIAKNGSESLFSVFATLIPEVQKLIQIKIIETTQLISVQSVVQWICFCYIFDKAS